MYAMTADGRKVGAKYIPADADAEENERRQEVCRESLALAGASNE